MTLREFSYPSSDGVHTIHGAEWTPAGPPRGVVQIVHGISEYILRYAPFAEYLADHGFIVTGADHLGHGGTAAPEERGYFGPKDGWRHVLADVRALRLRQGARYPGLPYVLMGHSMGSFLARHYLICWPGTVDAAILSGTGQEPAPAVAFGHTAATALCRLRGPNSRSRFITALALGRYNQTFRPVRTTADWISRDKAVVDAYLADPLCSFTPTVGMFRDMMSGLKVIGDPAQAAKMDPNTPVYFFSGDRDPVGSCGRGVERVAALFRDAGCRDVTVRLYPGGRHEMLNELNRRAVYADTLAWLEKHI